MINLSILYKNGVEKGFRGEFQHDSKGGHEIRYSAHKKVDF